ncbi:Fumarylacetoacetase [Aaosphaeria arxii CBS 175.79]|uniref:Fumarylacetoacetase n=1 Tax=Aaosphaeria arxii CBS 175.79 TaxID=1450172 RepID=A0A6A5Y0F8_9PLEO|nr:Fumarylacetoacetase [Aaosphaeria arxii CBS 175.79]KAF2019015.1 Fumarylacetoacetase [Aaosphaeria arxii CBS 175.79]
MSTFRSWFAIPRGSHFSLANIPFGIISTAKSETPRVAVAIGDHALDLEAFAANNGFNALSTIQPHQSVFSEPTLNAFAALGRPLHAVVRKYIQSVFAEDTPYPDVLKNNSALQKDVLLPLKDVKTHLPMRIGDYTDFFAGMTHAFNAGCLFRDPKNALQPNYKHLPVGYHGRASSVVVSGTPIRRPNGQILLDPKAETKVPIYSSCKKLDIELELGAFVCKSNKQGEPLPIGEAEDSLFGVVLMNDWSARDIQAWEYVPLGPFNAKNFGTTISPWVVLADALAPFKVKGLENDTEILPYLQQKDEKNVYDIQLKVDLKSISGNASTITQTSGRHLLWSFPQMMAHHTITGCPLQVGDLIGSGTISGPTSAEYGSLLEQTQNGKSSITIAGGEERRFLEDGDEVTITGVCGSDEDALVGFGQCVGRIEPALKFAFAL